MVFLSYLCEIYFLRPDAESVEYQLFGHNGLKRIMPTARPLIEIAGRGWVNHARLISDRSSDVRAKAAELLQRPSPPFHPELCDLETEHWRSAYWRMMVTPCHDMLAHALVKACQYGLSGIADDLIRMGAVPEDHADCLRTPLQAAAASGSIEVVQLLVNKHRVALDHFCRREAPSTALAIACHKGHEAIIRFLLEQGANPNARREPAPQRPKGFRHKFPQRSPMGRAYLGPFSELGPFSADSEYVWAWNRYELKRRARVSPLHVAAMCASPQVVSLLLDYGANVNLQLSEDGPVFEWKRGPLEAACSRFHMDLVSLLLRHGARLDVLDHTDIGGLAPETTLTPLAFQSSESQLIPLCSELLNHATATNWHGTRRWSERVLGGACARNWLELSSVALQYGPDIDAVGYGHFTALQHACGLAETPQTISLISLLLTNGADANARASSKQPTPLQGACEEASSKIVALLLAYGGDPNLKGPRGKALRYACRAKEREAKQKQEARGEIIRRLVSSGADINAGEGSQNGTLLVRACQQQRPDVQVIQHLLKNGANVEARDINGLTALQHACSCSGNLEMIGILLGSGADCTASGGFYGSALRIAAHKHDSGLFEMLLGCCGDEEEAEQCRQAWIHIDGSDESEENDSLSLPELTRSVRALWRRLVQKKC